MHKSDDEVVEEEVGELLHPLHQALLFLNSYLDH
jgi:hypothetical protein